MPDAQEDEKVKSYISFARVFPEKVRKEKMMIEVKRVEVRDSATLIPAIALRVNGMDDPLLRRAGFENPLVILIHLMRSECHWDPYDWSERSGRTMRAAHVWLEQNWECFMDGEVLDVEFILGETKKAKVSEL